MASSTLFMMVSLTLFMLASSTLFMMSNQWSTTMLSTRLFSRENAGCHEKCPAMKTVITALLNHQYILFSTTCCLSIAFSCSNNREQPALLLHQLMLNNVVETIMNLFIFRFVSLHCLRSTLPVYFTMNNMSTLFVQQHCPTINTVTTC